VDKGVASRLAEHLAIGEKASTATQKEAAPTARLSQGRNAPSGAEVPMSAPPARFCGSPGYIVNNKIEETSNILVNAIVCSLKGLGIAIVFAIESVLIGTFS